MARTLRRDWRAIAEHASRRADPQKLMIPVGKLSCALEGERGETVLGE